MKTNHKTILRSLLSLAIASFVLGSLSSCNTMRGLGHDIRHLGAEIEEEAAEHD